MKMKTTLVALSLLLAACGSAPMTNDDPTTTSIADTTTTTIAVTSTSVAETTTTTAPDDDPDVAAIRDLYAVVFDSATSFEEKSGLIEDPSGLEGTVATYASAGAMVGGVTAEVTGVEVSGDDATVTYTLKFSGNPTYQGLAGSAVRTADGWKVSRQMFCSVMASARSACPAS